MQGIRSRPGVLPTAMGRRPPPDMSTTGVNVNVVLYPPGSRGRIALFGSGETARVGRRVHELLLAAYQKPVPIAVIETPAGFQPNTNVLAQEVKTFFEHG